MVNLGQPLSELARAAWPDGGSPWVGALRVGLRVMYNARKGSERGVLLLQGE